MNDPTQLQSNHTFRQLTNEDENIYISNWSLRHHNIMTSMEISEENSEIPPFPSLNLIVIRFP